MPESSVQQRLDKINAISIALESYEGMEIADGGAASREYARVTFGSNIEAKDRQKVRDALEKYCELDAIAMVEILGKLRAI